MEKLKEQITELLITVCTDEYASQIAEAIYESVKADVVENSAYEEDSSYSISDVKLAIGRELMDKYDLWT